MRKAPCTLITESWDSALAARRYHPARQIVYREGPTRRTVTLGAGSSDEVHLFRDRGRHLVLSVNRRLDYVHLAILVHGEISDELFLDKDHELADVLGPRLLRLQPSTMARRMTAWLDARAG